MFAYLKKTTVYNDRNTEARCICLNDYLRGEMK